MPEARGVIRKIAAERVSILFDAAVKTYPKDKELSRNYIKLLLEIGRHYKVRISPEIAAHVCKKCSLPLLDGVNAEIRVLARQKRAVYRCKTCGSTNSLDFKK